MNPAMPASPNTVTVRAGPKMCSHSRARNHWPSVLTSRWSPPTWTKLQLTIRHHSPAWMRPRTIAPARTSTPRSEESPSVSAIAAAAPSTEAVSRRVAHGARGRSRSWTTGGAWCSPCSTSSLARGGQRADALLDVAIADLAHRREQRLLLADARAGREHVCDVEQALRDLEPLGRREPARGGTRERRDQQETRTGTDADRTDAAEPRRATSAPEIAPEARSERGAELHDPEQPHLRPGANEELAT